MDTKAHAMIVCAAAECKGRIGVLENVQMQLATVAATMRAEGVGGRSMAALNGLMDGLTAQHSDVQGKMVQATTILSDLSLAQQEGD